ncbi:MAG: hypothetical protein INR73_15855 [Williamsia sp.]|nr:hypothetical protein [Williamsia sp.]
MFLVNVSDGKTAREFIAVNPLMNQGNPHYIRPLDKDVHDVFDPAKNKAYRFGQTARWILKDDQQKLIGRIAAFTNTKYKNKGDDVPVGGIGFFDCINNQEAADMLFDVAKHWLLQQGMQAMDGPINFGERDRWWGLLVEGFDPPVYCLNYNLPYYRSLFETYGFKLFYQQICFAMKPKKPLQQKLYERHALIAADPDFSVRWLQHGDLDRMAKDFTTVYNKAWAGHGGLKELNTATAVKMFKSMKPVMDKRVIWFTYYKEEPIALFVNLPDLNQWFRSLNGQFGLLAKLKFLWLKWTRPCTRFVGLVFGVIPEYQQKGVDAYMIIEAYKEILELPYEEYEMQWIGDFNPKMIRVAEGLGAHPSRKLTTYRYYFDRLKEFKRHPQV